MTMALAAVSLALWASLAAYITPLRPGATAERYGTVTHVVPGGPAWVDGIREGQPVSRLVSRSDGTWLIRTYLGSFQVRESSSAGQGLRRSVQAVAATVGLSTAVLAISTVGRRLRSGSAAACLALILAGLSLAAGGFGIGAAIAPTLAGLGLTWWVTARSGWPTAVRGLAATGLVAVTAAWLGTRVFATDLFDLTEALRLVAQASTASAVVATSVDLRMLDPREGYRVRRPSDLLIIASGLGLVAFLVAGLGVTFWLVVLVAVGLVLLYPATRRTLARAIDDWLWFGAREAVWMGAVEHERRRLFLEIHDGPLQELAAVARRLEDDGGRREEAAQLRGTAMDLRRLVADLHPAVLEELGLSAALEDLVESATQRGPAHVHLERIGEGASVDPPSDVALAAYRIAQEAISNAQRHADAAHITLRYSRDGDGLTLEIQDDGRSVGNRIEREGFGTVTLRRRAAAIGAELAIGSVKPVGTLVRLAWRTAS